MNKFHVEFYFEGGKRKADHILKAHDIDDAYLSIRAQKERFYTYKNDKGIQCVNLDKVEYVFIKEETANKHEADEVIY